MRKLTLFTALLGAAASFLARQVPAAENTASTPAAPAIKPSDTSADAIVAKGKGLEVKRSQLDEAVASFKANAAAQVQTIPPGQTAMLEPGLLDRLIQMQILVSKATDAEKA